ncbi:MAG TPA: hypothetical protein V6D05_18140, partial [Stenomitos sp.]
EATSRSCQSSWPKSSLKHCGGNERAMVAGLLRHLTPEMLLLLDRGFFSYELWRACARSQWS